MIPDQQREALAVLAEVWALSPEVRLGQLLAHLGFLGEAHIERGLGSIEDDELVAILYRHRAELLARSQSSPQPPLQRTGGTISVSGSPTMLARPERAADFVMEVVEESHDAGS
jgi:hypothetical protein